MSKTTRNNLELIGILVLIGFCTYILYSIIMFNITTYQTKCVEDMRKDSSNFSEEFIQRYCIK